MFIENVVNNKIYDPWGSNTLFRISFCKHTTSEVFQIKFEFFSKP